MEKKDNQKYYDDTTIYIVFNDGLKNIINLISKNKVETDQIDLYEYYMEIPLYVAKHLSIKKVIIPLHTVGPWEGSLKKRVSDIEKVRNERKTSRTR